MCLNDAIKYFEDMTIQNKERPDQTYGTVCVINNQQVANWLKELVRYRDIWIDIKTDIQTSMNIIEDPKIISGYSISLAIIDKYLTALEKWKDEL